MATLLLKSHSDISEGPWAIKGPGGRPGTHYTTGSIRICSSSAWNKSWKSVVLLTLVLAMQLNVVVSTGCSSDEFHCHDGTCIMSDWECDLEPDCPDGSDEKLDSCGLLTCRPDHFSCGDGLPCIPELWRCDAHEDCNDGSDELNCTQTKCKVNEFQCNDTKRCITDRWQCDHDNDCIDGSDEINCKPETCKSDQFNCSNSRCIPLGWYCDGDNDCADNSDELNCTSVMHTLSPAQRVQCGAQDFQCVTSHECVHKAWICDGDRDCQDGSDETDALCGVLRTCSPHQFQCVTNGTCIDMSLRCDKQEHCSDGSDERDCPSDECDVKTMFDCTNGSRTFCIPKEQVCDRVPHCPLALDETEQLCNHTKSNECLLNTSGCSDKCVPTATSYYCQCTKSGYQLGADNKTCEDIDECRQVVGICSQLCENRIGSYKCSCHKGYERDHKDSQRCKATGKEPSLLFANRHDLREYGLHSSQYRPLVDHLHSAIALDYDYQEQLIYWSDVASESITRRSINTTNGTVPEILVTANISTPDGLALDWIHKNLYWTDTGNNRIEVMSVLDPAKPWRMILFDEQLDEPRAIVVDPREHERYMYWTDWGDTPKIERANLDGSQRTVLLGSGVNRSPGLVWPNGLAIDYESNSLFWVDAKLHHIGTSDLTGSRPKVIFTSFSFLKHPFAVTVFEDDIYWSDWEAESILKVSKHVVNEKQRNNQTVVSHIAEHLYSPMDVHVYHALKQPNATNACKDNLCSHLCFPMRSNGQASFVCRCSHYDGKYTLLSDNKTCQEDISTDTDTQRTTLTTKPTGDAAVIPPVTGTTPRRTVSTSPSVTLPPGVVTKNPFVAPEGTEKIHGQIQTNLHTVSVVIGLLIVLLLIALLVACIAYVRCFRKRAPKGLNFDNPVYRRTTEDEQFCIERSSTYLQPKALSSLLQPLNSAERA